jgi:hypothetical protein
MADHRDGTAGLAAMHDCLITVIVARSKSKVVFDRQRTGRNGAAALAGRPAMAEEFRQPDGCAPGRTCAAIAARLASTVSARRMPRSTG